MGVRMPSVGVRMPSVGVRMPSVGVRMPWRPMSGCTYTIVGVRMPSVGVRMPSLVYVCHRWCTYAMETHEWMYVCHGDL